MVSESVGRFCSECNRQIYPYREGYTKCKRCFLKSEQRLRNHRLRHLDRNYYPRQEFSMPTNNDSSHTSSFLDGCKSFAEFLQSSITKILILMAIFTLISPLFLFVLHSDMSFVLGNPRPIYFYDIDSSCGQYATNIESSLAYLTQETKVKFIKIEPPFALFLGGISYTCEGTMGNAGAVGEAEAGFFAVGFFLVNWNQIRLNSVDPVVILHETLHSMGFAHNDDPQSIMYPYSGYQQGVEKELSSFIEKKYTNPLAYINIFPINLIYILLILIWIIFSIFI